MLQKLHKNAKTNYAIRLAIRQSSESVLSLAQKYHLSWQTVKKWRKRENVEDKSSRPHKLRISLTQEQEDLILFERKKFKKTVEEIFFSVEGIIPNIYPSKFTDAWSDTACLFFRMNCLKPKEESESSENTPSDICTSMLSTRPKSTINAGMCSPVLTG